MIRHLLVAHDLTPEADVALARAAQLARQHDARVSLLHVYDPGLSASAVKTVSAMLQLKRKEAGLDEDSAITCSGASRSTASCSRPGRSNRTCC